jgi:hypothetical protein
MALWVAEIHVEPLERQSKNRAPVGACPRCEVKEEVGLARAVRARQESEDRALHRRMLEEVIDGLVDLFMADAHREHRLGGR